MDILCADETGTLTHNALEDIDVVAMPDFGRDRVLALSALASSETDQDPIDAAIRAAATASGSIAPEQPVRLVPFDPVTKMAEAFAIDRMGGELRVITGAFEVGANLAQSPGYARQRVDELAAQGQRILAAAAGPIGALRLVGLAVLIDPPRHDSAALVASLSDMIAGFAPLSLALRSGAGQSGQCSLALAMRRGNSWDSIKNVIAPAAARALQSMSVHALRQSAANFTGGITRCWRSEFLNSSNGPA